MFKFISHFIQAITGSKRLLEVKPMENSVRGYSFGIFPPVGTQKQIKLTLSVDGYVQEMIMPNKRPTLSLIKKELDTKFLSGIIRDKFVDHCQFHWDKLQTNTALVHSDDQSLLFGDRDANSNNRHNSVKRRRGKANARSA